MRRFLLPAIYAAALACLCLAAVPAAYAGQSGPDAVTVDVPVKLTSAGVVFNNHQAVFDGDVPSSLKYMRILHDNLVKYKVKSEMVGVFHGDATYIVLNDKAYGECRGVTTGNPYKAMIASLMADGVAIEVCAVALTAHHWGNADLLPGVKVNTGGLLRVIELTQKGYVQLEP